MTLSLNALADGLEAPFDDESEADFGFTPLAFNLDELPAIEPVAREEAWTIAFRPLGELYRKANEPAVLLRELGRLGAMTVQMDTAALPSLEALDPEDGYLAWRIELDGAAEASDVREVFEFVDGDCDLVITRAETTAAVVATPQPEAAIAPEPVHDIYKALGDAIRAAAFAGQA